MAMVVIVISVGVTWLHLTKSEFYLEVRRHQNDTERWEAERKLANVNWH